MADKECKRCLLYELADQSCYQSVLSYLETIPEEEKCSAEEYSNKLDICKECDYLLAGTCRKCGCYVEIRAAIKHSECPATPSKW